MDSLAFASHGPLGLLPDLDKNQRYQDAQGQPESHKFTNLLTAALAKSADQTTAAPPTGTYQVQAGDNLSMISKKLGITDPTTLAQVNKIKNPNQLSVGQTLKLPSGREAGVQSTPPLRREVPAGRDTGVQSASHLRREVPAVTSTSASATTSTSTSTVASGAAATKQAGGKAAGGYTVQEGDNLWKISKKLGLADPSLLTQANGLDNPNQLKVGQVLQVPGTASPAVAKQVAALQSPLAAKVVLASSTQPASRSIRQSTGEMVTASWYGGAHQGRLMANGRPFNMYADTVAHKSLPFGTQVNLTNPQNGQSAKGVVTDRGPFIRGRQLDVSYNLARKLGFVDSGVARLKMDGG